LREKARAYSKTQGVSISKSPHHMKQAVYDRLPA